MTPNKEIASLLPKLTGSDGTATEAGSVVPEVDPMKPVVSGRFDNPANPPAHQPAPVEVHPPARMPAPDPEAYWVDTYGNIWRKLPEPEIILTFNPTLTHRELDAVMAALLAL